MVRCHSEEAAKECGMYPAEKVLKKQGDKGEKKAVKIQEQLCLGVWCRWALGQWRKWFVRMPEPKDCMPGAGLVQEESGWGFAF